MSVSDLTHRRDIGPWANVPFDTAAEHVAMPDEDTIGGTRFRKSARKRMSVSAPEPRQVFA
jgi:hypothetical protein